MDALFGQVTYETESKSKYFGVVTKLSISSFTTRFSAKQKIVFILT